MSSLNALCPWVKYRSPFLLNVGFPHVTWKVTLYHVAVHMCG